jgi:hypothetical protein
MMSASAGLRVPVLAAVRLEAEPPVERACAVVPGEDPERGLVVAVLLQPCERGVEERGAEFGAPAARLDVGGGDLGGALVGVLVGLGVDSAQNPLPGPHRRRRGA